ncbi:UNVERIFIED_CONTAM: hypothetical protein HDU68_009403 [Siphonaria sp. JEL0065]|nr:hypothetical protein HDU68_009403 [Siphonaria sp. JEL0065]
MSNYIRLDDQQELGEAPADTSILTSALRRALSPTPGYSTNYNHNNLESDEEIWVESPPPIPSPLQPKGKALISNVDKSIGDEDWNVDTEAYFGYANSSRNKKRSRWTCHPTVFLWNNRRILLGAVATVALAAAIVCLINLKGILVRLEVEPLDANQPIVILVSLDGLREEYLSRGLTPNLAALAASGISASFLVSSFPSLTFPNHYSIITGLYPESHGIVANVFFDTTLNDTFVYVDSKKNQDAKWWGGEPLWVTSVKNGLKSATMMWPGSEAPIHGTRPTYYQPYNGSLANADRVSQVISWLSLPLESRPAFLTLYISDIDTAGHKYGPTSPQVNAALRSVDANIGALVEGVLKAQNVESLQASKVNIIVVSDHGMAPGNAVENFIYLDDILDPSTFSIINNVVCFIYPKDPKDTTSILATLKTSSAKSTHWQVWARDEVPPEFHFSTYSTTRIGPIVALPNQGYALALRSQISEKLKSSQIVTLGGMHGYNNSNIDMRAIFVAAGPAFKSSERVFTSSSGDQTTNVGGGDESVVQWEVDGGELGVDSNGHVVVALHGGAAIGGNTGIHRKDYGFLEAGEDGVEISDERRRRGASVSSLSPQPFGSVASVSSSVHAIDQVTTTTVTNHPEASLNTQTLTNSSTPQTTSTNSQNGTFIHLQMIPHFENVQIYNLILRILKLNGRGAPNNGTKVGMDLFEPWLNY